MIDAGSLRYRVWGVGAHGVTGVRFYERDPDRHGRDVRIWQIDALPDCTFTARHDAAIQPLGLSFR